MADSVNLVNNATALDTAPAFSPFTGVKLWRDDTNCIFAGNDTGRVLEADLPWATQEIADGVLASIVSFEYQPFSAQSALLDPAAELGDGVSVGGVYSVLASVDTNFNAMCASNISAPADEEIDHEYHYTSPEKRMERRVSKMNSELRVMSDKISSVVEGAAVTYRQETVPESPRKGDLWYVSGATDVVDGSNAYKHGKWYFYDGGSWVETTDISITENSAKIEQTAESITSTVTTQSKRIDDLEETVSESKSSIEQTANAITAEVQARENADSALESKITQTAESIETRVSGAENTATTALQTANGFSQRITDAEGNIAEIEFSLEGVVYESSLAEGTTTINGGCITTGTIDASKAKISNLTVTNANITSLDAGKLTVAGQSIGGTGSYLDNIYAAKGTITTLTSHGLTLDVNSADEGVSVLVTATGVKVGSNAIVSWQDIIAGSQNATAVFG